MTALEVIRRAERILDLAPGVLFDELSERAQGECVAELRDQCDRRNRFLAYGDDPRERSKLHLRAVGGASRRAYSVAGDHEGRARDPLRAVPLPVAFEILTGEPVPPSGMVRCPAPGHEDLHPSCRVGDSHFRCFGCGARGSVYDLGSLLSGIPTRRPHATAIRARASARARAGRLARRVAPVRERRDRRRLPPARRGPVGAIRARGPYPVLVLHGEQGSAKSTTARIVRDLLDPSTAPVRSAPRNEHELAYPLTTRACSRTTT